MPDTTDLTNETLELIDQASAYGEGSATVLALNDDPNELLTDAQAAIRYDRRCPPPPRGVAKKAAAKSKRRKKIGVRSIELLNESKKNLTKASGKIRKLMRTS